ncbi:MTH1187 family thiamine-binding protein [Paucidesulfovibrio longus]|uniref:MTH1187 family thiamine-binding protein n=1 Tax=Paucidesulfovibrio longus TaxID=889 RepID=UPI0003B62F5E|nr:MTH1187 family thiamine-binding protein [Paucidesulfovibrio longus]
MSVIANLAIFPLDKGVELSAHVGRVLRVIRACGLPHQLGPMGTCIEGEYDEVMAVVRDCFEELRRDCDRVYLTVSLDYRAGAGGRMQGKVRSVERFLESADAGRDNTTSKD